MADTVRHFMEDMVPELEDLEEKGYLTKAEIRNIVRKRENFEYSLKRRKPTKSDFLRYVEYETSLDELIRLRKLTYGIKVKLGKGELGCVKRCHMLYDRATKKFKGDMRLWLNWLEFCRASGSSRQMSKVVTRALQLHPKEPSLWIYAAAWEFEANKDATGARSLMQQGLRISKRSEELWLEYLRMELIYAQKLRARQKVLGIGKAEKEEAQAAIESETIQLADEDKGSLAVVIRGDVAMVVLKNALETLQGSLSFRTSVLQLLEETSLPVKEALLADVYADLENNFSSCEDAWDIRARRCTGSQASTASEAQDLAADQKAIPVYEAAINVLLTPLMFDHYATYLLQQAGWSTALQEGGTTPPNLSKNSPQGKAALKCLELYKAAAEKEALSEKAALLWPQLALACSKPKKALQAAETACRMHPRCADVWSQVIILSSQNAKQKQHDNGQMQQAVASLVLQGVTSSADKNLSNLWDLAVRTFLDLGINLQPLLQSFLQRVSASGKGPVQGGLGEAVAAVIRFLKERDGVQACRNFYRELLKLPAAGGACFHTILDIELSRESECLPDACIKAIFEKAIEAFGKEDTALWLRYADFDGKRGRGTGSIYWRATKELHNPEQFIATMSAVE